MTKRIRITLDQLVRQYDNTIDNIKILLSESKNHKSIKLYQLLVKEDIVNNSIMTPQTMSYSSQIFSDLSSANNLDITSNTNLKSIQMIYKKINNARKLILKEENKDE